MAKYIGQVASDEQTPLPLQAWISVTWDPNIGKCIFVLPRDEVVGISCCHHTAQEIDTQNCKAGEWLPVFSCRHLGARGGCFPRAQVLSCHRTDTGPAMFAHETSSPVRTQDTEFGMLSMYQQLRTKTKRRQKHTQHVGTDREAKWWFP